MSRKLFAISLVFSFLLCNRAGATQYAYQVTFKDKNNTPYNLLSPLSYLSPRSVLRRSAQGIAIDSTDLPVNQAYIDSVLFLTGGILHERSKWLNMCVILVSDPSVMSVLSGISFISNIRRIGTYTSYLHHRVSDNTATTGNSGPISINTAGKNTSLDNSYYSNTWSQTTIVNGNFLYDNGYIGSGKLIAVLDAGFIGTDVHPGFDSLRNTGRIIDEHNFTLDTSYVYGYDNHGSQVLSTMAGYFPGTFVGTAPQALYALYVTEDGNSEQPVELVNMLCGSERADSIGADIITTSLGYNTFDNAADDFIFAVDFDGKSTAAAKAANMATKKGILFVASAGNEGGDSWNRILTPGDADSALTIGSVDISGINAPASGFGPNAAGQVKPDVCGLGHSATILDFNTNGFNAPGDGTSFSTPQIAGWAACLWQANPGATPYQIRQAIIRCASHYTDPGTQIGYGIPNFQCTEQILSVPGTPLPFAAVNWIIASPIPFNDQLKLSVNPDTDGNIDFMIADMSGRSLLSFSHYYSKGLSSNESLSLNYLPSGIYLLRAVSGTRQQVIKLVKN